MKTIFDKNTSAELVTRINSLQVNSKAQWGKMNAYQMLKHCTMSEEMFQGKKQYKRLFIGRLFGGMALKGILKNEDQMKPNQPTHPEMKITGSGNFENEKAKWIELLQAYAAFSNPHFVHPFFGKMTKEQIGNYVYKHTDHHLRQLAIDENMVSFIFIAITLLSCILFYGATGKDKRVMAFSTLWILIVGIVSFGGYFTNTLAKPPRFLGILLGAVILSIVIYRIVRRNHLNSSLLLAIHTLRLPIELVLYQLYKEGKVPVLMTFKGWNLDIFMGISALILWLYLMLSKNKLPKLFILAWNIIGLVFLLFIVSIAIFSSPLPIQQLAFDQPNIAVLYFPYVYLPALVVPLVFLSHVLILRKYSR